MDFSPVLCNNGLPYDIDVYDSFNPDNPVDAEANYLGHLTPLGTIKASSTASIKPMRSSSVFVFENIATASPIGRATRGPLSKTTSYTVDKADEDAMTATIKFISFIMFNPDHAMTKTFYAIWKDTSTPLMPGINRFFAQYPDYKLCTFQTYMMGIVYISEHPAAVITPFPVHSLSGLVRNMGGSWPDGLPDIALSNYTFSFRNNLLELGIWIDLSNLPYESPEIAQNIKSMYEQTLVKVTLQTNFQLGLGIFGTRLTIDFDDFSLPAGSHKVKVNNPEVTIDINPLFKFVVFTLKGTIPFKANDTNLDANISLTVDNEEAHIGAVIAGDKCSFPAPPGLKGLFFDEAGLGIGLFFKPPAFTFGLETKFHIGTPKSGNIIELNDDTVAMVFKTEGEIPVPLFLSFYVPRLSINEVIELFTNANLNIDIPINFSDLSFKWAESIMNPVVLPDGSLADAGYHFSANIDIFSFQFHGDVALDLNHGLTADVEMSPLSWGKVFSLTGDGKGVQIKVDENGNPIRNNFVPTTQAEKDAVAKATDKQITTPGGPVLIINTLSMPILHLNAKASLFEIANYDIQADINKDGIKFELDYGVLLTTKMVCNLTDFHNLYAEFGYFIDHSIPLPTVGGQSLGSIPLKAGIDAHLAVVTSLTDIKLSTGGKFDFEGYHFSFGDFSADINISRISDFIGAVIKYIVSEAKTIFSQITDTAEHWAAAAAKGIVTGFNSTGKVLKYAYNKSAQEMANILKGAGFAANLVGSELKNAYGALSQDVASIMKTAGYTENEVADAIKNAWNCGFNDVAWAMQWVGYSATEVGRAVQHSFGTLAQDAANFLKTLSYTANQIGSMLKDAYGALSQDVASIMKAAGYAENEVADAIKNAWNCGLNDVAWAMQWVGYSATEVGKAVQHAFGTLAQDAANDLKHLSYTANQIGAMIKDAFGGDSVGVAKVMKAAGYAASEVAGAIRNAWNCAVSDVTWAMQQVGYAAQEIAGAVKDAFGDVAQDLAAAFRQFGIGAQEAADAVKNVFGKAINDTASILKQGRLCGQRCGFVAQERFQRERGCGGQCDEGGGLCGRRSKECFCEPGR